MDPIRVHSEGDVNAVVDKEAGVITAAEPFCLLRQQEKIATAEVFFPKLHRADAAFQDLLQNPEKISPLGLPAVRNQVKIECQRARRQRWLYPKIPSMGLEAVA